VILSTAGYLAVTARSTVGGALAAVEGALFAAGVGLVVGLPLSFIGAFAAAPLRWPRIAMAGAVALPGSEAGLVAALAHYGRTHEVAGSAVRVLAGAGAGLLLGAIFAALSRRLPAVARRGVLVLPALAPLAIWRFTPDVLRALPGAAWCFLAAAAVPYASLVGRRIRWPYSLALFLAAAGGLADFAFRFGENVGLQALLEREHAPIRLVAEIGRLGTDFDGDGASGLFGGLDCHPDRGDLGPALAEVAGNGRDDNCVLGDLAVDAEPTPAIPRSGLVWPGKPNVVVIVVDALRPDRMSLYGYGRPTTPRMAEHFSGAFRFRNAYSESASTRETVPSMLSGRRYPEVLWQRNPQVVLDPRNRFLSEHFSAHGYATLGIIPFTAGNMMGTPRFGFSRPRYYEDDHSKRLTADRVTAEALREIDSFDQPFVAWVHYYEPHEPYVRHREFVRASPDPYDQEIAAVDRYIGRLLDGLRTRGIDDRTIVVLTSDHGEAFGEHGHRFHNRNVYEEDVRVPLLIRVPGVRGRELDLPVSTTSIYPTLLSLVDLPLPTERPPTVPSLWPAMSGRDAPTGPVSAVSLQIGTSEVRSMVRRGDLKALFERGGRKLEVYDLGRDAAEKSNLVGREAALVEQASTLAQVYMEHVVGRAESRQRRLLVHRASPASARRTSLPIGGGFEIVAVEAWVLAPPGTWNPLPARVLVRAFIRRTGDGSAVPTYEVWRRAGRKIRARAKGTLFAGRYQPADWRADEILEDVRTFKVYLKDTADQIVVRAGAKELSLGAVRDLKVWPGYRPPADDRVLWRR